MQICIGAASHSIIKTDVDGIFLSEERIVYRVCSGRSNFRLPTQIWKQIIRVKQILKTMGASRKNIIADPKFGHGSEKQIDYMNEDSLVIFFINATVQPNG